jgi:hypothetical protein
MSDPQEHLDRAWEAAQEQVRTASNSQASLERAAAFNKAVTALRSRAVELLQQTATRIADEEKLSLQWMANVTSMSKARMGQYIEAARAARKGRP